MKGAHAQNWQGKNQREKREKERGEKIHQAKKGVFPFLTAHLKK